MYKIATLLLIFAAVISLVAIQLCSKTIFFAAIRLLTCRGFGAYSRNTRERQTVSANLMSASCVKTSSKDAYSSTVGTGSHSIAASYMDGGSGYNRENIPLNSTTNESGNNQAMAAAAEVWLAHSTLFLCFVNIFSTIISTVIFCRHSIVEQHYVKLYP